MSVKGKGLSPEELEIFHKNEEIFKNDFASYFKALNAPREKEFAQLRRKYQKSFVDKEEFTAVFSHKLSNPDEFCGNLCGDIKKTGAIQVFVRVPEDFEDCGCEVFVLNDGLSDENRVAFEVELKQLTVKFKSLFQAFKYMDNHIQQISAQVYSAVVEQKAQDRKAQMEKLMQLAKNRKNNIVDLPKVETIEEVKIKMPSESKNNAEVVKHPIPDPVPVSDPIPSQPQSKLMPNMSLPRKNLQINARQLTFRSLGSAYFTSLSLELNCTRCEDRSLIKTNLSESGLLTGDNYFEEILSCACTLPLSFKVFSNMIFEKSGKKMAAGRFIGCNLVDIPGFDVRFTCPDCGEFTNLFELQTYKPYIVNCMACFSKGTFQVDGFEFFDKEPEAEDKKMSAGKPLPKNGVCKHFKNSYRWFKYPCCQRLFPCMICHDDNTDHPSQKSELYVCGFCSTLQKCSQKNTCKKCQASINGQDSNKRFWEGGKGCRNTDRLSKNDKHKFKSKKK